MFNLGNNLKRSWQILWNYKVLWIFAFLLALFTGRSGGSDSNGIRYTFGNETRTPAGPLPGQWGVWSKQLEAWFMQNISPLFSTEARAFQTMLWVVLAIVLIALVFGLIASLVRYPAESAIIRMVDEHAATGKKVSFKEGWRLGWTRRAVTMFLIDLVLSVPVFLFVAIVLTVALVNLNAIANANFSYTFTPATGIVILLLVLLTLVIGLIMLFLGIVRPFFVRAAAIEGKRFGEAFERGWQLFKNNFGKSLLMWITLVGIMIGLGFVMIAAALILIPAYVLLAIPGAIVAAIPGAIALGIASIFTHPVLSWIISAIIAAPFFFIITFSPLILIGGLVQLYSSNNWTLTYRQFAGMEQPPALPATTPPTEAPSEPVQ